MRSYGATGLVLCCSFALAMACGSSSDAGDEDVTPTVIDPAVFNEQPDWNDPHNMDKEPLPDPFVELGSGPSQTAKPCGRGQDNAVTRALCAGQTITSIDQLLEVLGIGFRDRTANGENAGGGNPAFSILAHSTSLVGRSVNAINPRVFVFTPPPTAPAPLPGFVVLSFTRGEPFVELAAHDAKTGKITFYLIKFDLACEKGSAGCSFGDLMTPSIETGWQGTTLYDDEDLKNSILDCRQCHQPDASKPPILRQQEHEKPWTHWFRGDVPGGLALLQDFQRAHADKEDYGGIPAALIPSADGLALQDFVDGQGFKDQPNVFDAPTIEAEVTASASGQPVVNTPPGRSATWDKIFQQSQSGNFIPVPYHDVKITDPGKLDYAISSYNKFLAGAPADSLIDLRRVVLDQAMPEIGFRPQATTNGHDVLVQACAQCHNPKLDQTLTRARFDVTRMDTLSRKTKEGVIARLVLPESDIKHMPPGLVRYMTPQQLQASIDYLRK